MPNNVPGTPKIQVEVDTPFGQRVQTVDIDSNQIHPRSEFAYWWEKRLIPPARLPDLALRSGMVICGSAFLMSLLRVVTLPNAVLIAVALLILSLASAASFAVRNDEGLKQLLAIYLLMFVIGGALGVLL